MAPSSARAFLTAAVIAAVVVGAAPMGPPVAAAPQVPDRQPPATSSPGAPRSPSLAFPEVSPARQHEVVARHWAAWKSAYLRTDGGQGTWVKHNNQPSAVSEGQGWAMVLSAQFSQQQLFDELYRYYRAHPSVNAPNLMAWKQVLRSGTMVDVGGTDSATDGDMDIAYGLLLAHKRWGSDGTVNYKGQALAVLGDILRHDVNAKYGNLTPGDWATGNDARHTRTSDFMLSHLLAFARADPANSRAWRRTYRSAVAIVRQAMRPKGGSPVLPDFMVRSTSGRWVPVRGKYLETRHDGDLDYNACRTPWRVASAYVLRGKRSLLRAQRSQLRWIKKSTKGDPRRIKAGYFVNNGRPGKAYANYSDLAFTAPFAVNAMVSKRSSSAWLNRLWRSITGGQFPIVTDYFGDTIRMHALLLLSNQWDEP